MIWRRQKRFYHLIDRAVDFISRAREVHGQLKGIILRPWTLTESMPRERKY